MRKADDIPAHSGKTFTSVILSKEIYSFRRYGNTRNWEVIDCEGNTVCVTVYKKGAIRVCELLNPKELKPFNTEKDHWKVLEEEDPAVYNCPTCNCEYIARDEVWIHNGRVYCSPICVSEMETDRLIDIQMEKEGKL